MDPCRGAIVEAESLRFHIDPARLVLRRNNL
jgi:hypothetical protein